MNLRILRPRESGVALRLPPQSMTSQVFGSFTQCDVLRLTESRSEALRSQAFAVELVVAVPAAQGGGAGIGKMKWQRR